jgi:3-hydroxyisobutyrate dehydrogenase
MSNIAFLGLGAMGSRMAARLIAAGHAVTVWNRSATAAQALVAQGAQVAATPKAAAHGAEMVISMLTDDAAARAVWLDAQTGAVHGLSAGAQAVESSTVTPQWIHTLHSAVTQAGAHLIDAPVVGSRPQAQAGQLIFLVGGGSDAFARAQPVLASIGSAVHHAGALAQGAQLKLVVNALFAAQVAVLGELLGYIRRAGLDAQATAGILATLPVLSPAATGALRGILAQDFAPLFPIDLAAKDLGYALQAAQTINAPLPLADAVRARFHAAQVQGLGQQNITAVATLSM